MVEIRPLLQKAQEELGEADILLRNYLIGKNHASAEKTRALFAQVEKIYERLDKMQLLPLIRTFVESELRGIRLRKLYLDPHNMAVAFNGVPKSKGYNGIREYFSKLIKEPVLAQMLADAYVISHIGEKKV